MLMLAYGANTNIESMEARCPHAIHLGVVSLENYRLIFQNHADVEYAPGFETKCVLWDITESCETSLDQFEGYPFYYDKKYENVIFNGRKEKVMFYKMVSDLPKYKSPSDHYLTLLEDGYTENGIELEQIYGAPGFTPFIAKYD